MKESELRIGNLIWNPVQECPVKVTTRELDQIKFENKYKQHSSGIKHEWGAIQLTEEWLIKFGFELTAKSIALIEIGINKAILCFELVDNSYGLYNDQFDFKTGRGFTFACELKYVHQLQNLYFALTGKELKML